MALTDSEIRSTVPRDRPFKISDGGGLHLLINPNGSRLWRLKYRFQGKERLASFGSYPLVTLKEARQRRDEYKRTVLSGDDPMAPRRGRTFESVAAEWIERHARGYKPAYKIATMRRLEQNLLPDLGSKPIATIEAPDILRVLRTIEKRGAFEMAARMRALASQIFRFAIASGYAKRDPAADLRGALTPHTTIHHAALPADDLKALLSKVKASDEIPVIRLGILILAHTAVRASELTGATWAEIQDGLWEIPGERMKMQRPHIVPLSMQIRAMLEELRGDSAYVFASPANIDKPISNNAMLYAMYRAGYHSKMTLHGFRACFSTICNEEREKKSHAFGPEVIERQLAHCEKNEVKAAYNRATHLDARKDLMQWYSDFLDGKVASGPTYRIGDFMRAQGKLKR